MNGVKLMGVKVKIEFISPRITLMILVCNAHDNDSSIMGGLFHCRLKTVT